LEIILRNSRHLADLINDVLDLSQIEANRMALTKERVDIDEILDAAATAVRGLFEAKQLDFKIERAADLPPVLCDRTRVRQVLLNLLSNAARFTESGGVCLRARQERDDIVLAVTDTGPGVAQSDIDRLFQPFEQLDGSIRRKHEGSGLGLSISRRFVEMHGGTMWMESEPGHGCTVAFRLPVDGPLPPATTYQRWLSEEWEFHERTRPSLATPPVVKPRLIVVNAGSALQNLLRRYLDNAELVLVADLDAAISEAARRPAELLLVNADSVSQELDRLILGGMLPPGLPTILCTMPSDSAAIAALGATDYLVKPIAQERLLAMMAHLNITDQAILVVDDEPEAVLLYMRMLTGAGRGYRVLSAANGTEALKLIRSHRPAVVLLDLVMPEMDGFRVLAECRADPALRDLPIIVISAKDAQGQPVVSGSMAITLAGGITTQHLLATIEAMRAILLPGHRPTNHALATGAATPPPLPEASITAAGDPARGSAHPGNRPG
ncbi:MAG: ATP-binding protein, partial [Chloroflexi bacterium]|nr:ATP-binding protein [Chloroflexota bacterium]